MNKAILVAAADEPPFAEIHRVIYPVLSQFYRKQGYDLFFVFGRPQNAAMRRLRRSVEEIRWGRFHLILRLYDFFVLSIYRFINPKATVIGDKIKVNVPEDLRHLSVKILCALRLLQNHNYSLVVRTTMSSIIMPRRVDDYLASCQGDSRILYAGKVNHQEDGFNFVSGSFTILNKEAIELLLKNRSMLDYSLIDDVSFGKLFLKFGIVPESLISKDVDLLNSIDHTSEKTLIAHFRCKGSLKKRNDIEIMQKVIESVGIGAA